MKALILAAGFGTRLEESYQNYSGEYKKQLEEWVAGKPKGLVIIRGKPVLQHQLEQLLQAGLTPQDIFVHTNALYHSQYLAWGTSNGIPSTHIFNNGVMDNDHRAGAVGDLRSALRQIGKDDIMVMASDTLLFCGKGTLFNFKELIEEYSQDKIGRMVVYEGLPERLSRHGIVEIDDQKLIIGFEEKPQWPKSNLVNASTHIYTPKMIETILQTPMDSRDESGILIKHLYMYYPLKVVYAARRVDIGTVDDVLSENIPPQQHNLLLKKSEGQT